MASITWRRVKTLNDINAVDNFEKKYGISVPNDLKKCIINNNGGRPTPKTLKTKDGEELEVKALLSYNKDDIENIHNVIEYFIDNYSGKLLPFALDSAGNYYCIKDGKVVLWTQDSVIYEICDSFTEFLNMIEKEA